MNSLDHELKNLKAESEQTAEMNLKLKNELDALRQETISQVSIKQQVSRFNNRIPDKTTCH